MYNDPWHCPIADSGIIFRQGETLDFAGITDTSKSSSVHGFSGFAHKHICVGKRKGSNPPPSGNHGQGSGSTNKGYVNTEPQCVASIQTTAKSGKGVLW